MTTKTKNRRIPATFNVDFRPKIQAPRNRLTYRERLRRWQDTEPGMAVSAFLLAIAVTGAMALALCGGFYLLMVTTDPFTATAIVYATTGLAWICFGLFGAEG